MQTVRHAEDRGLANLDWLNSRHTFSFGQYYDPDFMGFGPLRVINEDRVQPGQGFGTHGHEDMEIVSYVIDGALAHKDSMGEVSVLRPGDVQRMSAGTGVRHSEFNDSDAENLHFLQIWILPEKEGLEPSYEEKTFPNDQKQGRLRLIGSRDGRDDSLTIHQDVDLYAALIEARQTLTHELAQGRKAWVQVARGKIELNGQPLREGDGVAIEDLPTVSLAGTSAAEVLLFDMGEA